MRSKVWKERQSARTVHTCTNKAGRVKPENFEDAHHRAGTDSLLATELSPQQFQVFLALLRDQSTV